MKDIKIGYLDLYNSGYVSRFVINSNFLDLVSRYAKVIIIPMPKPEDLVHNFENIQQHQLDYLYLDCFNFLVPAFLLREKLGLDLPFIVNLHTVFVWVSRLASVIPLLRHNDIIIAPSQYAKKAFSKMSDKFKAYVIPRFFDLEFIQNAIRSCVKENNNTITTMSRLTADKGIDVLIECMPEILSKVEKAHLSIIGPLSAQWMSDYPKDPYVQGLERKVKRLNLAERVSFKRLQLGANKYKMLSEARVFVNASVALEENLGCANIEAMACGLPVIASDWAGHRELIKNGENGYLVDIKRDRDKKAKLNKKQLVSLVVKILKNKKLQQMLKENAIWTAKKFDYKIIVPAFIALLKKNKPNRRTKNRWHFFTGKTVSDFSRLFNREFLFFLHFYNNFKLENYDSLYAAFFPEGSFYEKKMPNLNKDPNVNNKVNDAIINRIRHNFLDLMLSK
jgi:glycosyltransferase involved in cell wall biosynthesis